MAEGIDFFGSNLENPILENLDHTSVCTEGVASVTDGNGDNEIDEELDSQLAISTGCKLVSEDKFHNTQSSIVCHSSIHKGQINGRNGSVACATISVMTAMLISSESLKEGLTTQHAKIYVGCIEIGNIYHGNNGFFFAVEMSLLPDDLELLMKTEFNCFINSLLPCL